MLDHKPKYLKRFGQHFLHDQHCLKRIIETVSIESDDCFIEIGPGGGALTGHLLPKVKELIAIEIDPRLCQGLTKQFSEWGPRFSLYNANALTVEPVKLIKDSTQTMRFIGNLPYNIATPLLFHWLQEKRIKDFHIMVQKEVADRLVAKPGSKAYSRLSVIMQYHCQVHQLFRIKPGAFYPPPKVESSFVKLVPRDKRVARVNDEATFVKIIKAAFNQRRKMIVNSLASLGITRKTLQACSINPTARAEALTIDDYVHLANVLAIAG